MALTHFAEFDPNDPNSSKLQRVLLIKWRDKRILLISWIVAHQHYNSITYNVSRRVALLCILDNDTDSLFTGRILLRVPWNIHSCMRCRLVYFCPYASHWGFLWKTIRTCSFWQAIEQYYSLLSFRIMVSVIELILWVKIDEYSFWENWRVGCIKYAYACRCCLM